MAISRQKLGRELRPLNHCKLSTRPRHHGQDSDTLETFKKGVPTALVEIADGVAKGNRKEVLIHDEIQVGPKNGITLRWARRGTLPAASKCQCTVSAFIFGAICPKEGKGTAIVMPRCNTATMTAHLAEISDAVVADADADAHAVVLLDQAGWHTTNALNVPDSITLIPPPSAP